MILDEIIRQDYGRFDRRMPIGPARWPHHDLLWIHDGAVRVTLGGQAEPKDVAAPGGLLIAPGTAFSGTVQGSLALASITHFTCRNQNAPIGAVQPPPPHAFRIGAMVELSQTYAQQGVSLSRRIRLLTAILDAFEEWTTEKQSTRVETAWQLARGSLSSIRGVGDVAAGIRLSESTFRALHRSIYEDGAGAHLTRLRVTEAERLLSTTSLTVADVAKAVGYASGESLTHAFRRLRNATPAAMRRMSGPFA